MTNETKTNGKLYKRIAEVSRSIGALVADGRNTDQNYEYITADKILDRANRAMSEAGLVVIPEIVHESTEQVEYQSYGKTKTRFDAVIEFDMVLADEDGNAFTRHWIGRGTDWGTPDKALYKAITSGHKYFLMKLFSVGVGNEDGEHEAPPDEQPDKQTDKRGATSPKAQAQRKRPARNGDNKQAPAPTDAMKRKLHAVGGDFYGDAWDDKRAELCESITKGRTRSSNDLTGPEMAKLIDGIEKRLAERDEVAA